MRKWRRNREKPRLVYFVTEDWYFCSHRIAHARAARDAGFEVVVAAHTGEHGNAHSERIRDEGFRLEPVPLVRRSMNPFRELATLIALIRLYARQAPDIAQHVAVKPVLYGSLAARLTGVPHIVNAVTGMGYVFISGDVTARLLRPFIKAAYRLALGGKNTHVVLQNNDDRETLAAAGILRREKVTIIAGSGVDTKAFTPAPEKAAAGGTPLAVMVTRMLWDKGVGELVEAARELKSRGVSLRIALIGEPDPHNPAAIAPQQLESWQAEGVIEYWGRRDDIAEILRQAQIAVLPSYREGLPKSLLEAAAAGLPIIATDVPGCREIVKDGENGLLVPVRESAPVAGALEKLAGDAPLRARMGVEGRRLVEERFSEEIITGATVGLYKRLIGGG